jgi:hypothetical protein
MASRRLALSLQQGMRSRAAINAIKSQRPSALTRGLASPVSYGSKTESTTLSNGFTVGRTLAELFRLQLTPCRRSLPSTRRGPRRRPSACGSMLAAAPRRTGQTEPHTSSSISPSRYERTRARQWQWHWRCIASETNAPRRAPRSAPSSNWSSRLRTWAAT